MFGSSSQQCIFFLNLNMPPKKAPGAKKFNEEMEAAGFSEATIKTLKGLRVSAGSLAMGESCSCTTPNSRSGLKRHLQSFTEYHRL